VRIVPPIKDRCPVPLGEKFGCHPKRVPSLLKLAKELDLDVVGVRSELITDWCCLYVVMRHRMLVVYPLLYCVHGRCIFKSTKKLLFSLCWMLGWSVCISVNPVLHEI